ncbi:hypothetical protein COCNU_02G008950 [Cocos nucifera]|uniref:Uncharacterized protein n=1 Tax=Cocos nucifera TaxID=13894 RepID=A0A8K0HZW3_COCNU|nr:hypothetical protein COCNU_02G008950 [Cocos nucifera]
MEPLRWAALMAILRCSLPPLPLSWRTKIRPTRSITVNTYPMFRGFTAIGTGGDDFVQDMVAAVVSVLQQPILQEQVTQRLSSRGKYVSVYIGPIRVCSVEEVQAVYSVMRRDDRTKFLL